MGCQHEAGALSALCHAVSVTCCLSPFPVYACKLSDREHPLYLRLVAGPRTDSLSFVLREHEIGEVSGDLFTVVLCCTGQLYCFKEVGAEKGGCESPK